MQISRKLDKMEQGSFIFFDLKNSYNAVSRELLIQKLKQFNIPCNIISTVTDMLWEFSLKYRDHDIPTKRGLVQGSTQSLILFNIFINDLLNEFTIKQYPGISIRWWCSLLMWKHEQSPRVNWNHEKLVLSK